MQGAIVGTYPLPSILSSPRRSDWKYNKNIFMAAIIKKRDTIQDTINNITSTSVVSSFHI